MGYTDVDQLAINTIRVLAVCFFLSFFYPPRRRCGRASINAFSEKRRPPIVHRDEIGSHHIFSRCVRRRVCLWEGVR